MHFEDEEFLPASHPLNLYFKSIDLDEDVEESSFQPPALEISEDPIAQPEPQRLSPLQYFYMQVRTIKAAMITMIITSDILVEDDTYIAQHYLNTLDISGSGRKMHLPSFFFLSLVGFAFVLASLHFLLLFFCLLVPLLIVFPLLASHFLLRAILARIKCFHTSFRKSILFLQGLACSERGLTFIAIQTGQGRISTTCFPQFLAKLHKNLKTYIGTASELSVTAHDVCRHYSLLEFGGYLGDLSPDVLAATSEPALPDLRGLHEFLLFLDSEVLRRVACLLSSEPGLSVRSSWRLLCLLSSWNWQLRTSFSSMESLDDVRLRLLTGKHPSQKNIQPRGGTGTSEPGTMVPTMFISHLDSLNYHLVNWCERIRVLREKAMGVVPDQDPSAISALVSEDLQLMRHILKNCETCLNEAESVTLVKPLEEQSGPAKTWSPSSEINKATSPVKLEAVDLPTEDEVIEAVADPDSASPADGDLGIDDDNIFTGGLDLKTLRQRSENRSLLLSELNSVIAHRLSETRERERQALLKSKGLSPVNSAGETTKEGETHEEKELVKTDNAAKDGDKTPEKCTPMEVLHDALQGSNTPHVSPVGDMASAQAESTSESAIGELDVSCSTADSLTTGEPNTNDRNSSDFPVSAEPTMSRENNTLKPISVGLRNLHPPPEGLLNENSEGLRPLDHLPRQPFSNLGQLIRQRRPSEETFDEVATGEDAYEELASENSSSTNP